MSRAGHAMAAWATYITSHAAFEPFIMSCILLIAVTTVVELEEVEGANLFLELARQVTQIVFSIEVVLKIAARGVRPLEYFTDLEDGSFNTFDFIIVILAMFFDVAAMRLLRLLKIVGKIKELRVILLGLTAGICAVLSIMMLLGLIIYLYAITGVTLFAENDPGHFGRVGVACLYLFQCATLSGWGEMYEGNYFGCDLYDMGTYSIRGEQTSVHTKLGSFLNHDCVSPRSDKGVAAMFFFVSFTVLTSFVILSLFISVITMSMFEIIELKALEELFDGASTGMSHEEKRAWLDSQLNDGTSKISLLVESAFLSDEEKHAALLMAEETKHWYIKVADSCGYLNETISFQVTYPSCAIASYPRINLTIPHFVKPAMFARAR